MNSIIKTSIKVVALAALSSATLVGCGGNTEVSFKTDINPILQKNCLKCHVGGGAGEVATGLNMTSYENLMKGTKFGPIIKPNDSLTSVLVMVLEGRADPRIKMPHGGNDPLTKSQIETIKTWVDQGAKNN